MKKIVIAAIALLVAGPALAGEVSCDQLGQMAYNAAIARDRGTSQDEVARTLAKNYGDDRSEALTRVVFMHSEVDADTMQFATRLRCLQMVSDTKGTN